ncbi:DUF4468 domain-containing protein [Spirosoma sp. BT702]|uniref:DUF4468 domain-containing protein n=1 Tax=Spirosoma profusum TaxID=2771354 RepID=A0A927G9V6_9BACT|nr:DUF4468 domain-containing protein [Spirosoma profusum]MBD2704888.1 DUF4468 domain-containing protein [Spirosoma profusum]
MNTAFLSLLTACLFLTGSVYADSTPNPSDGKLAGIFPVVNQKATYIDVVDCGSVTQTDVFRRVRLWLAQSNSSTVETFPVMDKETGDLAGRLTQVIRLPRTETSAGGIYTFQYSLTIECTNRKYRATITRIELEENGSNKRVSLETFCQRTEKDTQAVCAELDKQLTGVLASLQESVKNYKAF